MRRASLACLITITLLTSASTALADWHEFWHRVKIDYHRNNCWPEPFIYADRRATRAPFQAMVNNGWQRQTTLQVARVLSTYLPPAPLVGHQP